MAELVKVSGPEGDVFFEGDFNQAVMREIGVDEKVEDFVADVEARSSAIGDAISSVVESVRASFAGMATDKSAGGVLKEIEVDFGLKVSGEGRMFVAKAGAEVNLSVTITWDLT